MADLHMDVTDYDHIEGPISADATIVLFLDYHSRNCKIAYNEIQKIMNEYGESTTFILRPVQASKDPQALFAAEAAAIQGKYFEYIDLLFIDQGNWKPFMDYAKELHLDIAQFATNQKSEEVKNRIKTNMNGAARSNVTYIPAIFINGNIYEETYEAEMILPTLHPNPDIRNGIIDTARNTDLSFQKNDPDAYSLNPMPIFEEEGYTTTDDPEGFSLYASLEPYMTLDESEPSTLDQDFSDPEPS